MRLYFGVDAGHHPVFVEKSIGDDFLSYNPVFNRWNAWALS